MNQSELSEKIANLFAKKKTNPKSKIKKQKRKANKKVSPKRKTKGKNICSIKTISKKSK